MGYIRFDVDKINDFVFESYKPVEVSGGSEWIKLLDEDGLIMSTLVNDYQDLRVVYARGGGGLLWTNREEEVCKQLSKEYEEKVTGGKLTAVHCEEQDNFRNTYNLLNYLLREKKNQKALLSLHKKAALFTPEDAQRRCNACGKRKGKNRFEANNEEFFYCDVCINKRNKGKEKSNDIEIVSKGFVMMIYGDLNEAGDLFASMDTEVNMQELSNAIFDTLNEIRVEMERVLMANGFNSLMPVAGGDDLIIFIPPAAFHLIKDVLFGVEERLEKAVKNITSKKLKMNISFLTAKYNHPIYNLFTISEELLKLTKKEYYKKGSHGSGKTHYGFYKLEEGNFNPGETDVYQKDTFAALFDFARGLHQNEDISSSAIFQLLDLLPVRYFAEGEGKIKKYSKKEENFNISYHLSRNETLADLLVFKENEYELKGIDGLKLNRHLWEDVIDMKEMFPAKKEAE